MAEVTAALVKDLREKTGAGILDCKRALTETGADLEGAIDWLRKKGLAAAAKKSGRVAAEGLIGVASAPQTRRHGRSQRRDRFRRPQRSVPEFRRHRRRVGVADRPDVEALKAAAYPGTGRTVADELIHLVAIIGENMNLRRVSMLTVSKGVVASYVHQPLKPGLGKIGVLVAVESSSELDGLEQLGRQIGMHVAAARPDALDIAGVDPAALERERAILVEKARRCGPGAAGSWEPSTNSTSEWTMLCGCTTTSTWSMGTPKSHRASIISSPLLNSVAESMVILRPMFQVGCFSACSGVTSARSLAAVLRNGPPDASQDQTPHMPRWFPGQALENRVVLAVHRQDGHVVPLSLARDFLAGHHQNFLAGHRQCLPRLDRLQRRGQAGRADDGNQDEIGPLHRRQLDQAFGTAITLGPRGKLVANFIQRGCLVQRHRLRLEFGRLGQQRRRRFPRGQPHDLHPLGQVARDLERAFTDRSGAAENDNAFT